MAYYGTYPFPVSIGGTGNTTQTAYSLVCGGTTANGAFQAISPSSSIHALLLSTGNSSLPAWSTTGTPYVSGISFDSGSTTLSTYVNDTVFTPVLTFGGGSTGLSYTQIARYNQIGGLVAFFIQLTLTAKGSSSGNATISGLPVTSTQASVFELSVSNLTFSGQIIATLNASDTVINLMSFASGGTLTSLTDSAFANTTAIYISGFYF